MLFGFLYLLCDCILRYQKKTDVNVVSPLLSFFISLFFQYQHIVLFELLFIGFLYIISAPSLGAAGFKRLKSRQFYVFTIVAIRNVQEHRQNSGMYQKEYLLAGLISIITTIPNTGEPSSKVCNSILVASQYSRPSRAGEFARRGTSNKIDGRDVGPKL